LTLRLNDKVIERAKIYAKSHKISLSKMIESYLDSLTREENKDRKVPITPLIHHYTKTHKDPMPQETIDKYEKKASYIRKSEIEVVEAIRKMFSEAAGKVIRPQHRFKDEEEAIRKMFSEAFGDRKRDPKADSETLRNIADRIAEIRKKIHETGTLEVSDKVQSEKALTRGDKPPENGKGTNIQAQVVKGHELYNAMTQAQREEYIKNLEDRLKNPDKSKVRTKVDMIVDMHIARAYNTKLEQDYQDANNRGDKKEAKVAFNKLYDFQKNVVKPLQTIWSRTSLAQPSLTDREKSDKEHKRLVRKALEEGKPVPDRVLNEYPDLKAEFSKDKSKEETPKEPTVESKGKIGAGVSQKAIEKIWEIPAENADWEVPKPGEGASPEQMRAKGEKLYNVMTQAQRDEYISHLKKKFSTSYISKIQISEEDRLMAIAHSAKLEDDYERLYDKGDKAGAKAALKKWNDFQRDVVKRLGIIWQRGEAAQQGEEDMETGKLSFFLNYFLRHIRNLSPIKR